MKLNQWLNNIQSILIPPVCVLCGAPGDEGQDLCAACRLSLPRIVNACVRCAEPLSGPVLDALCGRCQVKPPAFEQCLALLSYETPVDHLLQRLKFDGRLEVARILGRLMADHLASIIDTPPELLIPVPLHRGRLRERGFNQAVELARPVSKRLGVPLDLGNCQRLQSTASQSGLSRKARIINVRGAFVVAGEIRGHVAIVDDVMTTGSTAHELTQSLLKAGAERVDVWVCARA